LYGTSPILQDRQVCDGSGIVPCKAQAFQGQSESQENSTFSKRHVRATVLLEISSCVGRLIRQINDNVIAVGAQSERRGDAWPARGLLGGKDLAGRVSYGRLSSRTCARSSRQARKPDLLLSTTQRYMRLDERELAEAQDLVAG
jgi:hypothetical protein